MKPQESHPYRAALLIMFFIALCAVARHAIAQATIIDPSPQPASNVINSPGDPDAVKTTPDIEIGTPTTDLRNLVTPMIENGGLKDGHHGPPIGVQEFLFNPATHEITLAKNSPIEQQLFANTEIDSGYFPSDLGLFNYLTDKRAPIGKIILTCANKKLFVSYNYIVSIMKDDPPKPDPASFCASVQFVKGDECNKPGTTVTVHRNAEKPAPLAEMSVSRISRKTDNITWSIERGGAVIQTGSFGFPLVGNEPGLVKYVINLP